MQEFQTSIRNRRTSFVSPNEGSDCTTPAGACSYMFSRLSRSSSARGSQNESRQGWLGQDARARGSGDLGVGNYPSHFRRA